LAASKERVQIYGIAPDGSVIAYYHENRFADPSITLHNGKTGTQLAKLKGKPGYQGHLRFTGDSRGVLTWDDDLILWDATTGEERKRWELPGRCRAVGLSADGKEPVSVLVHEKQGDRVPFLWNVQLGERMATIRSERYVDAAAFSADGQVL